MTNHILSILGFILAIVAMPWANSAPQTISQVNITRSGFLYNRQIGTFDTTVTIQNMGVIPLAAPMNLILELVQPVSVSLYNIYDKTANGKPYVRVPLPGLVLDPGKSATVPIRFVNPGKAVTSATFSVQAERLDPAATAKLNIAVMMDAENGGNPVGAGYAVQLDGVTRALTDAQGLASIVVPLDVSKVGVSKPPNYFGVSSVIGLNAGETRIVNVELGDSGELGAESMLRIDLLQHLMLPRSVPLVVLRFFQNEKAVASERLELAELRDPDGGPDTDLTNLFTVRSDGSLAASPATFFAAVGDFGGKKLLFVQVLDKQGVVHKMEVPFYISLYMAKGKLSAPPSNPSLPLGGILIQVSMLGTDITFQTESASDGSFPLPVLPTGSILIHAETSSGGHFYLGQGPAVISSNVRIDLKMRGSVDVTNNVIPIITSPL